MLRVNTGGSNPPSPAVSPRSVRFSTNDLPSAFSSVSIDTPALSDVPPRRSSINTSSISLSPSKSAPKSPISSNKRSSSSSESSKRSTASAINLSAAKSSSLADNNTDLNRFLLELEDSRRQSFDNLIPSTSTSTAEIAVASPHVASPAEQSSPLVRSSSASSRRGSIRRKRASTSEAGDGMKKPKALDPAGLIQKMHKKGHRPFLVIDVRPLADFLGPNRRLHGSINVNCPTLLIKRFKRGNVSSFNLDSFITTQGGKEILENTLLKAKSTSTSLADIDICIVDEHMGPNDVANSSLSDSTGATILNVIQRSKPETNGHLYYLASSFRALAHHPEAQPDLIHGEDHDEYAQQATDSTPSYYATSPTTPRASQYNAATSPRSPRKGLLTLQPTQPKRGLPQLSIAPPTTATSVGSDNTASSTDRTPTNDTATRPMAKLSLDISDSQLRPKSPLHLNFGRQKSNPNLRENKPPSLKIATHAATVHPDSAGANAKHALFSPLSPRSPRTLPTLNVEQVKSPRVASIRLQSETFTSSSSEDEEPTVTPFTVSTIIPNSLYLGPEPCNPADVENLESLGIKRILNMALECQSDSEELGRQGKFEKITSIPMRDSLAEVNVQGRLKDACFWLDDADLHSSPAYVHCKAGKSRSVTVILAYLIHRNRWSLKEAYAHVSKHRAGISPNIGFVAELMRFEESTLGTRSTGVGGSGPVSAYPSTEHTRSPETGMSLPIRQKLQRSVTDKGPANFQSYSAGGPLLGRGRVSLPPQATSSDLWDEDPPETSKDDNYWRPFGRET